MANCTIELNGILEKLRNNTDNYFEFYDKGIRFLKKYHEVYDDVLKVIKLLERKGIQYKNKVGILCGNTYEWLLLDLACIAGGYTLFAFHEKDFSGELEKLMGNYQLNFLFLQQNYYTTINDLKDERINSINEITEAINTSAESWQLEKSGFEDEDVYTVIFTSGTTGFPKGVELRVCSAEDFVINLYKRFKFFNDDKIIVFLPMSVITSRLFIYGAILLDFNIVMTVSTNLVRVLPLASPTILQGVPYLFETIYDSVYKSIKQSPKKYILFSLYKVVKNFIPENSIKKIQKTFFKEIYAFWGGKMRFMVTGSAPTSKKILKFYNDIGIDLFEAYGQTEAGLIAINTYGKSKIGSVGIPFENKDVMIDENGQILVKGEYCWAKKYLDEVDRKDELNSQVFLENGYIATGDVGYIDKDGFLFLKGRIKELIVLSNGEKVHPTILESYLKESQLIKQSCVFGSECPFISAVVVKSLEEITYNQIEFEVNSLNKKLPEYQQIKGIVMAEEAFTIENGLLNSNLKLCRTLIHKKYESELAALY